MVLFFGKRSTVKLSNQPRKWRLCHSLFFLVTGPSKTCSIDFGGGHGATFLSCRRTEPMQISKSISVAKMTQFCRYSKDRAIAKFTIHDRGANGASFNLWRARLPHFFQIWFQRWKLFNSNIFGRQDYRKCSTNLWWWRWWDSGRLCLKRELQ